MSDQRRSQFERLYRSIHGEKHNLTRSYLGYENPQVNSAFFFWSLGLELGMNE